MNRWVLCFVISVISLFSYSTAMAQPKAMFDNTSVDFGFSYPNTDLSHDFVLTNKGNEPLEILNVRTSCGCTAAIPSATRIPMGASTVLSVTMSTLSTKSMHKTTTVNTNDPQNPSIVLDLRAKIHQVWDISPSNTIYFDKVPFGEIETKTIFMDNIDGSKYQIVGSKLIRPEFNHSVGDYIEGKGYPIKVEFQAPNTEKHVRDTLIVRTNDPRQTLERIQVLGRAVGPIQFSPSRLFFGTVQSGQKNTREVTVQLSNQSSGQTLQLTEIRAEPKLVEAQVLGYEGSGAMKIRFTFHAPESPGLKRGTVFIKTNLELLPEAELSYTAVVR